MTTVNLPSITFRYFPIEDDKYSIFKLLEATGFFYPDEIIIGLELVEEKLALQQDSTYQIIFAQYCNQVISYICYGKIPLTRFSYDVYWIATHPDFQGNGIGHTLLTMAEEIIKSYTAKHVYIETSGRDIYKPTHNFYINAGYILEAVFKDFYADGDDKYIFHKKL